MKLSNEIKHKVTIENELGEKVDFVIDASDMVQLARIGNIFEKYNEMSNLQLDESDDFEVMLASINKVADKLVELNKTLDLAFGKDITEKAFMGSSSLLMYNDFFSQLAKELEVAGVKVNNYIKKVRKETLVNDHKQSDTI